MSPTRRQVLKWGVGIGALTTVGAGALIRPPRPSAELAPARDLAIQLFTMLNDAERAGTVFDYEHPLRQYHNRGADTGGRWTLDLSRSTRQRLVDLVHASLSKRGRERLPNQQFLGWTGLHASRLAIFGDPRNPPYQILVSGPHHNLRLGGRSREDVAFGGPQVYGDQRGDGKLGLPGNIYRSQLELCQQLFASLSPGERKQARKAKAPVQTRIGLQGASGSFDGVPIAELGPSKRERARDIIASMLATYADEDASYAWDCIEQNGGVDALHLADYTEDHEPGSNFADSPSQIFRLEGPAAVFYYRGSPHLHAYLNVAMDGEHPLSVGEVVAQNPTSLGPHEVKALFEEILSSETEADLAYYPADKVAGRLRQGTIRTGDIYSLESWKERICVNEIKGSELAPDLAAALRARGKAVQSNRIYRVATARYVADNPAEVWIGLGVPADETTGAMLRDVTIAHLARNGLPSTT